MNDYVDDLYFVYEDKPHHFCIEQDEDPWHPRDDQDGNLGHMMCWYPRYNLGDYKENNYDDPYEFLYELMNKESNKDDDEIQDMTIPQMLSYLTRKNYHFIPLAVYEHSGLTMWAGSKWSGIDAQWDCSDVGWIYTTMNEVLGSGCMLEGKRKWRKVTKRNWREAADKYLRYEVEHYDMWLNDEVYGFHDYLVDEDGDDGEEENSSWGYYEKYSSDLAEKILYDQYKKDDVKIVSEDEAKSLAKEIAEEEAIMAQADYIYAV